MSPVVKGGQGPSLAANDGLANDGLANDGLANDGLANDATAWISGLP